MYHLAIYTLGVLSGFMVALLIGLYADRKQRKDMEARANKIVESIKKEMIWASAKARFDKAAAIADRQNEILGRVEGPSKGALYSKWRNDVRSQLIDMEREKMDIFRSILADGLDPVVNIIGEGGEVTKKKMSETVADFDRMFPEENIVKISDPKVKQSPLKLVKLPENPQ